MGLFEAEITRVVGGDGRAPAAMSRAALIPCLYGYKTMVGVGAVGGALGWGGVGGEGVVGRGKGMEWMEGARAGGGVRIEE